MSEAIPYIIIIGVVLFLIISIATSRSRIRRIYRRYMDMPNSLDLTGKEFAFISKKNLRLSNLKFALTNIELGDAYSSKSKTLIMSEQVCNTASIASIAIVAHELGHAVQDKNNNFLLRLTHLFRKITKVTNKFIIPSLLVSLICFLVDSIDIQLCLTFLYIGSILFVFHIFNHLLCIPLEHGASKIAMRYLKMCKGFKLKEYDKISYLLNVAVQTYIASFFDDVFLFVFKRRKWC